MGVMYVTAGTATMALDAVTCELRWRHEPSEPESETWSDPVTVDGVRACPGILGGVEWSAPAYHPPLDLLIFGLPD